MVSCPPDKGSFVMKSIMTVWKGHVSASNITGYRGAFLVCVIGGTISSLTIKVSECNLALKSFLTSTVFHHLLRGSKDGNCKYMSVAAVNNLYSMTLSALDVLECEHHELFLQCAKCQVKVGSM